MSPHTSHCPRHALAVPVSSNGGLPCPPSSAYQRARVLYTTVPHLAQDHSGWPRPPTGGFLMLPHWFHDVMAREPYPVAHVILEVMRQTLGQPGDGPDQRGLWAPFSYRDFERRGRMPKSVAQRALAEAVQKKYLVRRPGPRRSYLYAIRWDDVDYSQWDH
jgi:hypothetical protein